MIYIALVMMAIIAAAALWLGILLFNGKGYSTKIEEEADVLTFSSIDE
ncbi:MAG: hypothetical protein PQJ59_01745 [Spirochaetales bacterium]|nr:hypothetical protein [Spirochaetales bacterium]